MRKIPPLLAGALFLVFPAVAARAAGDGAPASKSTYEKAYGKTKAAVTVDAAKELARVPAVEPRDAVGTWKVRAGIKLELAAHEPQVRDPVAVCFDENGRLFVCEMIDYSEQREVTPHLGRVSMLEDRDGDGRYETSRVFADDLPWPTGLIWARGTLYVGATPDIWRIEDRDGDGVGEKREKVFTGFGTGLKILNVQGLMNSFTWGQDNRVHVLAGGGNRGKITCPVRPWMQSLELEGRDFWFNPRTMDIGLEAGGAQFGMSFDDFGRKFGCSNSDHLQYWLYEDGAGGGNPFFQMAPSRQSIAVDGGAAEVFRISPDEPWRIIRTRWRVSGVVPGMVEGGGRVSGYFTGATGTTIYRGDALGPAFSNNSFTGDAGGQLIHRKVIRLADDGVNLAGERPADERGVEFAASTDTWVRPVAFANAPDGCLWVCDMYREVIEHPWSIPDEIKKHLDLNSGNDRGRLYRISPEKGAPRVGQPVRLGQASTAELVKTLGHPNGWHRDTAQRLLVERHDPAAIPLLGEFYQTGGPLAKLHALAALEGLGNLPERIQDAAMKDPDEHVRERAFALAARGHAGLLFLETVAGRKHQEEPSRRVKFQEALTLASLLAKTNEPGLAAALRDLARVDSGHPWISQAILTAPPDVLTTLLPDAVPFGEGLDPAFVARLIEIRAASQPARDRAALIRSLTMADPPAAWLGALGAGLRRAGTSLEKADTEKRLAPVFARAAATAGQADAPEAARLAAVELLGFSPNPETRAVLAGCLGKGQPEAVQTAAVRTLAEEADPAVAPLLVGHWSDLGTPGREVALSELLARKERLLPLLEAVQSGRIPAAALSAAQVQGLAHHADKELAAAARKALAPVLPPSRDASVAKFQSAAALAGDAARGRVQFTQRCQVCHRADGLGVPVGPDLVTVKSKGRDALLTAILEPNKEVAAQYISCTITTKDGETLAGIISEDTTSGVTIKMAGGATKTVERSRLKGTTSAGQSLMPEGLETGMTPQDMADLLSFIAELK